MGSRSFDVVLGVSKDELQNVIKKVGNSAEAVRTWNIRRSADRLPPKSSVYDYFDLWTYDGTMERIHHALYEQTSFS